MTEITEEDIQFLKENRNHYDTLVNAGYMRGLSGETRQRMQDTIRKYWEQTYHTDLWCPPCVSDMLKKLYRHYDEWLAQRRDGKHSMKAGVTPEEIIAFINENYTHLAGLCYYDAKTKQLASTNGLKASFHYDPYHGVLEIKHNS